MIRVLLTVFLIFSSSVIYAADLNFDLSGLGSSQSEFSSLVEQVGTVVSYKAVSPAEPLGILGFDVGLEVSTIAIDAGEDFWKNAVDTPGDIPDSLIFPKVHAQKGLPFGFDVGLAFSTIPNIGVSVVGAELKYAFIGGNLVMPAIAVRGTYSQLMGVDDMDLTTTGIDVSVSKGLAMFTPYLGLGQTFVTATENNATINLDDENISFVHGFAGVKFSLLLINFVGEVDVADVNTYSFRANIGL